MEDIITLVEGRAKIVDEVRSSRGDVREAIRNEFTLLLKDPGFHDAFPGHLSGITGARQRASLVMQRFEAIAS